MRVRVVGLAAYKLKLSHLWFIDDQALRVRAPDNIHLAEALEIRDRVLKMPFAEDPPLVRSRSERVCYWLRTQTDCSERFDVIGAMVRGNWGIVSPTPEALLDQMQAERLVTISSGANAHRLVKLVHRT